MLIKNKRQYFKLAQVGLAGNANKVWNTAEEFLSETDDKIVAIRCVKPGSNFTMYVSRKKLQKKLVELSLSHSEYYLTRPIPPKDYLLAGELGWLNGNWVFWYTFVQKPMRDALREGGKHAYGYHEVWGLLSQYSTPADIEDLHSLFEQYTYLGNYPIIELTVTKRDWGIFKNRNTLIWEVRHY